MLLEARVRLSENVTYGQKETGLNDPGETGCACQKPEMFVCFEALNLSGGWAPRMVDSGRQMPLSLHSTFENECETPE